MKMDQHHHNFLLPYKCKHCCCSFTSFDRWRRHKRLHLRCLKWYKGIRTSQPISENVTHVRRMAQQRKHVKAQIHQVELQDCQTGFQDHEVEPHDGQAGFQDHQGEFQDHQTWIHNHEVEPRDAHSRMITGSVIYLCTYCQVEFTSEDITAHEDNCRKVFRAKSNFQPKTKLPRYNIQCKICPRQFARLPSYQKHLSAHSNGRAGSTSVPQPTKKATGYVDERKSCISNETIRYSVGFVVESDVAAHNVLAGQKVSDDPAQKLKTIKRSKPIILKHNKRTRLEESGGRCHAIPPKDQKVVCTQPSGGETSEESETQSCPDDSNASQKSGNSQRPNDDGYSESPDYQHSGNHGNQSVLIVQSVAKDKTFSSPRSKQATRTNSMGYMCKYCKGIFRTIPILLKHTTECTENKLTPPTKKDGSQDSSNVVTSPTQAGGVIVGRNQDGKMVMKHDSRGKGHTIAVDVRDVNPSKIVPRTMHMRDDEDKEVAEEKDTELSREEFSEYHSDENSVGSRKPAKPAVVLVRCKLYGRWKQIPLQNVQNSLKSNAGTGESDVQSSVKCNAASAVRSAPTLTDKFHVCHLLAGASQTPELACVESNNGGALQNEEVAWEEISDDDDDDASLNQDTAGEKTRDTESPGEEETLADLFTEDFEQVVSAVDTSSCDEVSLHCHPDDDGAFSVTVLEAAVKGHCSVTTHCKEVKGQRDQLKPFRCSICWRSFRSFDRMKRHQRLHMKRYCLTNLRMKKQQELVVDDKLSPLCGKSSSRSKSKWVRNINWICEICGKKFLSVQDWQEHARIYHLRLRLGRKSKDVIHRCLCCGIDLSTMIRFDKHVVKHMKRQVTYRFVYRPGKQSKQKQKTDGTNLKRRGRKRKRKIDGANLERESTDWCVPQLIQCMYCMKMFKNVSVASKHIADEHDLVFLPRDGQLQGRFQCRLCMKSFSTAVKLDRHKLTHPEYSTSMDYINVYDLNPNEMPWDMKRPYQCQLCSSTFKNSTDAHVHVIVMHESNFELYLEGRLTKLQCRLCSKAPRWYPSLQALLEHKNTHLKNLLSGDVLEFKADQIGSSGAAMDDETGSSISHGKYAKTATYDQSEHFRDHNLCSLCGMEFTDTSALLSHEKSHEHETQDEDAATGESIEPQNSSPGQEEAIRAELASSKPINGLFQCVHCTTNPKTFDSTSEASEHVAYTHDRVVLFQSYPKTKDRYRCRYCDTVFEDMQDLMIHKYTHSKYKTSMDYIQLTTGKYETLRLEAARLNAVLNYVSTKYECRHCNKRFTKDCDISNHILEYHDSLILSNNNGLSTRVYQCRFCDHYFATRDGLVKHKETHKGYMPYMEYMEVGGSSLVSKAMAEQNQKTKCRGIINEKEDHSAAETATTAPEDETDTIQDSTIPSAAEVVEKNLSPTLAVIPAKLDIPAKVPKSNSSYTPINIPAKYPGISFLPTFAAKVHKNNLPCTLDNGTVSQAEIDSPCMSANLPSTITNVAASQNQENKSSCTPNTSIESNCVKNPPEVDPTKDSEDPSVDPNSINSFLSDQVKSMFAYLHQDDADIYATKWSTKRPYKCRQCGNTYTLANKAALHVVKRHEFTPLAGGKYVYKCRHCGKIYLKTSHMLAHKRNNPVTCSSSFDYDWYCKVKKQATSSPAKKQVKKKRTRQYSCRKPNLQISTNPDPKDPVLIHIACSKHSQDVQGPGCKDCTVCRICQKEFSGKSALVCHMMVEHSNIQFHVPDAKRNKTKRMSPKKNPSQEPSPIKPNPISQTIAVKPKLVDPTAEVSIEQCYRCMFCKEEFNTKAQLDVHEIRSKQCWEQKEGLTSNKDGTTSTPMLIVKRRKILEKPQDAVPPEEPQICSYCLKRFDTKFLLDVHQTASMRCWRKRKQCELGMKAKDNSSTGGEVGNIKDSSGKKSSRPKSGDKKHSRSKSSKKSSKSKLHGKRHSRSKSCAKSPSLKSCGKSSRSSGVKHSDTESSSKSSRSKPYSSLYSGSKSSHEKFSHHYSKKTKEHKQLTATEGKVGTSSASNEIIDLTEDCTVIDIRGASLNRTGMNAITHAQLVPNMAKSSSKCHKDPVKANYRRVNDKCVRSGVLKDSVSLFKKRLKKLQKSKVNKRFKSARESKDHSHMDSKKIGINKGRAQSHTCRCCRRKFVELFALMKHQVKHLSVQLTRLQPDQIPEERGEEGFKIGERSAADDVSEVESNLESNKPEETVVFTIELEKCCDEDKDNVNNSSYDPSPSIDSKKSNRVIVPKEASGKAQKTCSMDTSSVKSPSLQSKKLEEAIVPNLGANTKKASGSCQKNITSKTPGNYQKINRNITSNVKSQNLQSKKPKVVSLPKPEADPKEVSGSPQIMNSKILCRAKSPSTQLKKPDMLLSKSKHNVKAQSLQSKKSKVAVFPKAKPGVRIFPRGVQKTFGARVSEPRDAQSSNLESELVSPRPSAVEESLMQPEVAASSLPFATTSDNTSARELFFCRVCKLAFHEKQEMDLHEVVHFTNEGQIRLKRHTTDTVFKEGQRSKKSSAPIGTLTDVADVGGSVIKGDESAMSATGESSIFSGEISNSDLIGESSTFNRESGVESATLSMELKSIIYRSCKKEFTQTPALESHEALHCKTVQVSGELREDVSPCSENLIYQKVNQGTALESERQNCKVDPQTTDQDSCRNSSSTDSGKDSHKGSFQKVSIDPQAFLNTMQLRNCTSKDKRRHFCKGCKKEFTEKQALIAHEKVAHLHKRVKMSAKYQLQKGDKSLPTKIKRPIAIEGRHICSFCFKEFNQNAALIDHEKFVHQSEKMNDKDASDLGNIAEQTSKIGKMPTIFVKKLKLGEDGSVMKGCDVENINEQEEIPTVSVKKHKLDKDGNKRKGSVDLKSQDKSPSSKDGASSTKICVSVPLAYETKALAFLEKLDSSLHSKPEIESDVCEADQLILEDDGSPGVSTSDDSPGLSSCSVEENCSSTKLINDLKKSQPENAARVVTNQLSENAPISFVNSDVERSNKNHMVLYKCPHCGCMLLPAEISTHLLKECTGADRRSSESVVSADVPRPVGGVVVSSSHPVNQASRLPVSVESRSSHPASSAMTSSSHPVNQAIRFPITIKSAGSNPVSSGMASSLHPVDQANRFPIRIESTSSHPVSSAMASGLHPVNQLSRFPIMTKSAGSNPVSSEMASSSCPPTIMKLPGSNPVGSVKVSSLLPVGWADEPLTTKCKRVISQKAEFVQRCKYCGKQIRGNNRLRIHEKLHTKGILSS